MGKQHDALFAAKLAGSSGGGGGTSDYTDLANKPQINGTTLTGDKSSTDLGLLPASTRYGASLSTNKYIEPMTGKKLIDTILKDQNGNAMSTIASDQPVIDVGCDSSGLLVTYPSARASIDLSPAMSGKADKSTTYTKVETDILLTYKQNALTSAQLAAANSGITAAKVGQYDDIYAVMNYDALNHNGIFRGKDLTNVYTVDEMYERIHNGTFEDLYLGDYFTKSITTDIMTRFTGTEFESGTVYYEMGGGTDVTARTWTETEDSEPQSGKTYATKQTVTETISLMMAAFNYYYNVGDTALTTHHAVLIPRGYGFATMAAMNSTNTTVGSYYNSDMHQITLPCYAKSLKSALNNHLLSHKILLPNAINASTPSMAGAGMIGASNGWGWAATELQLMNEIQLYGSMIMSSSAYDVGLDCEKLPVFNFINGVQYDRGYFWLRPVVNSTNFAYCGNSGFAFSSVASGTIYVRPEIIFG